jgi:DNA-binding NtrC family response regulator
MDGHQTARQIREIPLDTPIIYNTGYPGEYSRHQIESEKPFDFIGKNEGMERLKQAVQSAVHDSLIQTHSHALISYALDMFEMVGHSSAMLNVYRQISLIGPSDQKVLILGETGTGKEGVAKAIHRISPRAGNPFSPYNCGNRPRDLVDDELFGHYKGAFTGALTDRDGLLKSADKGTVFLDEIGELDLLTQSKLLRVLDASEILPVGADKPEIVDVRLICATNADLESLVKAGKFRSDLYFRILSNVICLPLLNDRREDIPALIDYFTAQYCEDRKIDSKYFDQAARDFLIEYDWEGNVRHLREKICEILTSTPSYFISRRDVEQKLDPSGKFTSNKSGYDEQVKDFKRTLIVKALDKHGGNVSKVAREFGKDPANMRKLIESLGISLG